MDSFYDFFSGLYPGNFAARGPGVGPGGAGADSFFGHQSAAMLQGVPYHASVPQHPMERHPRDPLSRNRSDQGGRGRKPGMIHETAPSTPQARSRAALEIQTCGSPSIHRRASADAPNHHGTPGGKRDKASDRSPRESMMPPRQAQAEWYGDPPPSGSRGGHAAATDGAHHDLDSRDVRASLDFKRPRDRSARNLDVARRESKCDKAAGSPYPGCRDVPSPGVRRDPGYGPEPVGSVERMDRLGGGASVTADVRQRHEQRSSPERLLHQGSHSAPIEPTSSSLSRDQHGNEMVPPHSSSACHQEPGRGQLMAQGDLPSDGWVPVSSPSYERGNPSSGGHGPHVVAPSSLPEARHSSPWRASPTASPMRGDRQIDGRQVDASPAAGHAGGQNGPHGRVAGSPQRASSGSRARHESHPQRVVSGAVPAYRANREDLLDQHVAYYLRRHPEARRRHSVARKRPGVYKLDGREVNIEWEYASEPGQQGFLVVVDGPLRQPFSDYMEDTEANAEYEGQDIGTSSLHTIPKDRRISFNDTHKVYSRFEAMKVAKEQALVREKAAGFTKEGKDVPQDIMQRYKKSIQQKLGLPRCPASPQRSPKARQTEPAAGLAAPSPPCDTPADWPQVPLGPSPGAPGPTGGGCSAALPAAPTPSAEVQQWTCTPSPPMAAVVGTASHGGDPSWSPPPPGTSQGQAAPGCSTSWSPPLLGLSGAASYSPPTSRQMPTATSGGLSTAASYTPPPVPSADVLQTQQQHSSYSPPPMAQQHPSSGGAPPGLLGQGSNSSWGDNLPASMSGMRGRGSMGSNSLGLGGLAGMARLGEGLGLPGMGALGGGLADGGMGGGCMSNAGMGMSLAVRGNSGAGEVGNSGQISGHNLLGGMPHAGSMGASHMGASPFSGVTGGSSNSSAHTGAYSGGSANLGTGGLGSGSGHNLLGGMPHAGSMGASHMGASPFSGVTGGSSNSSAHTSAYSGGSANLGTGGLGSGLGGLGAVPGNMGGPIGHGGVPYGAGSATVNVSMLGGAFPGLAAAAGPNWRTNTPMVRRQPVPCLTAPPPPQALHAPWSLYGGAGGAGGRP